MKLIVKVNGDEALTAEFSDEIIVGRQDINEPEPVVFHNGKVVVASLQERWVSRRHILFDVTDNESVKITNLSKIRPIEFCGGLEEHLDPGQTAIVDPPFIIQFDQQITIEIHSSTDSVEQSTYQTLAAATLAPGADDNDDIEDWLNLAPSDQPVDLSVLLRMLRRMAREILPSHSRSRLFDQAVDALVTILRLDYAAGLRWTGSEWKIESFATGDGHGKDDSFRPSQSILLEMRRDGLTKLHNATQVSDAASSLQDIDSLVAAPVLNESGDVIGALYGVRSRSADNGEITELEALLVSLLAASVASGIARIDVEQRAIQSRVQFEQFFSPKLAERLESEPGLLEGREAEVTVLFCDIRGYSSISHRIGAQKTINWLRSVMNHLSLCVTRNEGVLVDFIGDELMAMWGAPDDQPDHAERACRAALQMLLQLPEVSQQWKKEIGGETQIGIGINSGPAYVGNTGSEKKFKYGPLGNTVNVGSRIQGLTKIIRSNLIITGSTVECIKNLFPTRLLGSVRVVNISEAIDVYELAKDSSEEWSKLKEDYEQALRQFERRNFQQAASILGRILEEYQDDGPSLLLLSRAVNAMIDGADEDHPVWKINRK